MINPKDEPVGHRPPYKPIDLGAKWKATAEPVNDPAMARIMQEAGYVMSNGQWVRE